MTPDITFTGPAMGVVTAIVGALWWLYTRAIDREREQAAKAYNEMKAIADTRHADDLKEIMFWREEALRRQQVHEQAMGVMQRQIDVIHAAIVQQGPGFRGPP